MTKCYAFLIWILAVQFSFGDQNGSAKAFWERVPYKVNGHDVRIAVESFDYNKGTGSEAFVSINIGMPPEAPPMDYTKMKVDVADSEGERIVAQPTGGNIFRENEHQCAIFWMKLKKGQKIESVRIRWGDADSTFLYSKGQMADIYLF
ncbi:MAG: hypothetical protein ABJF10_17280 [Chthoniobacter sp.]|uniref:hypothetical protein n=1 Tax=Chthoniobacter sp. TaxID=2510640 RepID=UPI0032A77C7E